MRFNSIKSIITDNRMVLDFNELSKDDLLKLNSIITERLNSLAESDSVSMIPYINAFYEDDY
jgi:hypothetical protein